MTNRERVLVLIRSEPGGVTDSEIRRRTGISPHQQVNQICRKLAQDGLTDRRAGGTGRIVNVPLGSSEGNAQPSQRRTPEDRPGRRSRGRNSGGHMSELPRLSVSRTLFVLPCSGAKRQGGRVEDSGPSVLDSLPGPLAGELGRKRADNARTAKVDESGFQPAAERYSGNLYQAADDAIDVLAAAGADVLIISGGYGVVLAAEPIGWYDQEYRNPMWPNRLVPQCIGAYAETTCPTNVVGLLSASTPYARVFRMTRWPDVVKQVLLACPEPNPGARVKTPRALGEAMRILSRDHRLRAGWTSSDGLEIQVTRLR